MSSGEEEEEKKHYNMDDSDSDSEHSSTPSIDFNKKNSDEIGSKQGYARAIREDFVPNQSNYLSSS